MKAGSRALVLATLLLVLAPAAASATTYMVDDSSDPGPGYCPESGCTLREALDLAVAGDTIHFSGPMTITPESELPPVAGGVTIDAEGAAVEIDLACVTSRGLELQGSGSTVRGLRLYAGTCPLAARVPAEIVTAIHIPVDSGGHTVAGNVIGIDGTGTHRRLARGVLIQGSGNTVGGPDPADRNVIAAQTGYAVEVAGGDGMVTGNTIQGNWLGLDETGAATLGSAVDHVGVGSASGTAIRGNVIAGSELAAVYLYGPAPGTVIEDNLLNLDKDGLTPLPGQIGVEVGGIAEFQEILISGNAFGQDGVLSYSDAVLTITDNLIGADIEGTPVGDGSGQGVEISNGAATVGGPAPQDGNLITAVGTGVEIEGGDVDVVGNRITGTSVTGVAVYHTAQGATISRNQITGPEGAPIDLVGEDGLPGPTANDPGDPDTGGNGLQNHPVIESILDGPSTTVAGSLDSLAGRTHRLEFFASEGCGESGWAFAYRYLGSLDVGPDPDGVIAFEATGLGATESGEHVVATATDLETGGTSELSCATGPGPEPTPGPSPDPTPDPSPDPTPDPSPDPTPTATPQPTPTPTPEPEELPPPEVAETANVEPVAGRVRVKVKGSDRFVELSDADQIPMGSVIDTTRGRVALTSAADGRGATQTAEFYEGVFKVLQTRGRFPITEARLVGSFAACGRAGGSGATARAAKRRGGKRVRRLWGSGKGRFRTRGRGAAATVRGTVWLVEDRCGGTLTRVRRGRVKVRDFARKRTVLVKTGKRYWARVRR